MTESLLRYETLRWLAASVAVPWFALEASMEPTFAFRPSWGRFFGEPHASIAVVFDAVSSYGPPDTPVVARSLASATRFARA